MKNTYKLGRNRKFFSNLMNYTQLFISAIGEGIYQLLQSGTASFGFRSTDSRIPRPDYVKPTWKYPIQGHPWRLASPAIIRSW